MANVIGVESGPQPPLPQASESWKTTTPAAHPPVTLPREVAQAPDPLRDELVGEANRLPESWLATAAGKPWRGDFVPDTTVLYEEGTRRFVTVTAARVDCRRVDRFLRKQRDTEVGRPDRCARWLERARETMHELGITGQTPEEFLEQLGAETHVRVLLIYAAWDRDDSAGDLRRLLASEPVPIYPQSDFASRDFEARDRIYQVMRLGPHTQDPQEVADIR
jgi:hypothetical protein